MSGGADAEWRRWQSGDQWAPNRKLDVKSPRRIMEACGNKEYAFRGFLPLYKVYRGRYREAIVAPWQPKKEGRRNKTQALMWLKDPVRIQYILSKKTLCTESDHNGYVWQGVGRMLWAKLPFSFFEWKVDLVFKLYEKCLIMWLDCIPASSYCFSHRNQTFVSKFRTL